MQIEKQDVNLEKLFNWGKSVDVNDKYGNFVAKIYLRLVGDAELNRARVGAIRASRELRLKLKDHSTDEYMAYVPDFSELEVSDLRNIILSMKVREFMQEVTKELDIPLPVEPNSEASLEKQEEYQKEVDEYTGKRQAIVSEQTLKKAEVYGRNLEKESREYLEKEAERLIVISKCEEEMVKVFSDLCVVYGAYRDEEFKIRYFNTIEDFTKLPTEIKQQFLDAYGTLDLNVEELKKSLEVTQ
jgi:hypothetical protein